MHFFLFQIDTGGLPRQKFDNVQMALRIKDSRDKSVKLSNNNGIAMEQNKK